MAGVFITLRIGHGPQTISKSILKLSLVFGAVRVSDSTMSVIGFIFPFPLVPETIGHVIDPKPVFTISLDTIKVAASDSREEDEYDQKGKCVVHNRTPMH
jgi:hypothetical protein